MLSHQRDELRPVAGLADDLESRALEEARETLAQDDIVVRHHHPSTSLRGRGFWSCRHLVTLCVPAECSKARSTPRAVEAGTRS
jgi:hypothetical protein